MPVLISHQQLNGNNRIVKFLTLSELCIKVIFKKQSFTFTHNEQFLRYNIGEKYLTFWRRSFQKSDQIAKFSGSVVTSCVKTEESGYAEKMIRVGRLENDESGTSNVGSWRLSWARTVAFEWLDFRPRQLSKVRQTFFVPLNLFSF